MHKKEAGIRGEVTEIGWGNQIRSLCAPALYNGERP